MDNNTKIGLASWAVLIASMAFLLYFFVGAVVFLVWNLIAHYTRLPKMKLWQGVIMTISLHFILSGGIV